MDHVTLARISGVEAQVAALEQAMRGLYDHLGIAYPESPTDELTEVRRMVEAGDTIGAIGLYKSITGADMKAAKRAVEQIKAGEI
jgi:ribosomal protein L7/L12